MILNAQIVAAIVRHILTGVAGGMAVKYGVDGVTVDAIVGGAAALAGNPAAGASLYDLQVI